MSHLMPIYCRTIEGGIRRRTIDADLWPEMRCAGWYDAPDKVPPTADPPATSVGAPPAKRRAGRPGRGAA
jgi:hypothetical protein